jgi:hypothetical protein
MLSGFYFLTGSGSWASNSKFWRKNNWNQNQIQPQNWNQEAASSWSSTQNQNWYQNLFYTSSNSSFSKKCIFTVANVYVLFFPTVVRHVVILWKNFKHTFFWIINFRLDGGDGIRNVIIMFGTCFECAILFIILKNKNLKKFWNNINIWLIMLFQKFLRFLTKKIRNENLKYDVMFENISFVEMETSKRIIYLTSMCCNGQGTKFCCFLITTRLGRFFLER